MHYSKSVSTIVEEICIFFHSALNLEIRKEQTFSWTFHINAQSIAHKKKIKRKCKNFTLSKINGKKRHTQTDCFIRKTRQR